MKAGAVTRGQKGSAGLVEMDMPIIQGGRITP